MNRSTYRIAAVAMTLALAAGCGKKNANDLPPPPELGPAQETPVDPNAGAAAPGSRAHFIANVASDRVLFGTDEDALDAQDRQVLDSQAQWLQQYPNVSVSIEGHADERGTREYNLALGDRRANAAKNYLQSRGVPANRMTTISWGKERPEAVGSDESAWAQNRRAVTVVPQ